MSSAEGKTDPFEVRKLYKYLRVVDVCDALDGIGYFDLTLMWPEIRPLWLGMKFWGAALTMRCVPARRPMWKLDTTEEIVDAHGIWFKEVGHIGVHDLLEAGHVIVTDGYARDTAELALQKTPVCARARGRTIIPGRIELVDVQVPVGCGGVQVRPGDIVGCDDDGVVVVPLEVAEVVAAHARAILLSDMKAREGLYQRTGLTPDETVDYGAVAEYYRQFE